MEQDRFDDLARLVATKTSRRQVLKVLAGAAVGGLVGGRLTPVFAMGAGDCARYCNQVFGEDTAATTQCIQDAKRGTGLCYSACGPTGSGGTLCGSQSGGYYTSYAGTTCCTSGQTCQIDTCVSGTCEEIFRACAANSDCCSGYCDPNYSFCCASGTVVDGLVYEPCSQNSDCCSGSCGPTYHYCCASGTVVDGAPEDFCSQNSDCCSGVCNPDGTCQ